MLANIIIYTPASTGFNWAAVVGPLASGLVAAFTAVGVFIFSQRKERQKAHDDRVWVERMQAYTPVATWAFAWHEPPAFTVILG